MGKMEERVEKSIFVRGKILHEASIFEKMIDVFLSMYYAQKGKQSEFMQIFLSRTDLTRKANCFIETVGNYENDFKARNPDFQTEILQILKTRNIMAHEVLQPAGEIESCDESLVFDNYKKKRKVTSYSKEEVKKEIELIEKYCEEIQLLIIG